MLTKSYERATCDGGADDPRLLVYLFQQRLRQELLAKAAEEANRPPVWVRGIMKVWAATRMMVPWCGLATEKEPAPSMTPGLSLGEGAA